MLKLCLLEVSKSTIELFGEFLNIQGPLDHTCRFEITYLGLIIYLLNLS